MQTVEAPALAVMAPVLLKGLRLAGGSKDEATVRRACVIIRNMSELVDDAKEGAPLVQSGVL